MGNPAVDPAPYEASNAIADAGRIRTPLLLIHGMSDDNVVFDHAAAVISKLQESDTPFEMMLYPGQTHRIAGPERSEEHTSELQSLMRISYAVFCLKKKTNKTI